jgi:hypothetical protein
VLCLVFVKRNCCGLVAVEHGALSSHGCSVLGQFVTWCMSWLP